jgi:uracil-DNA glycosylase
MAETHASAADWMPEKLTLASLRTAAVGCRGCELWKDATQTVFSTGRRGSPLMLVGEQPGSQEDLQGAPFVGPAGKLLDDAMRAASIDPAKVYVTNAVKHFRFEQRGKARIHKKPGVAHIVACHPWLEAELEVVRPQVIVCLGATAARAILGRPVAITRERGRLITNPDRSESVVVTTHPSAVLRLRGKDQFDQAMDAFIADLETAAHQLAL